MAIKYPNKKFTDNIMNENFENVTNLWSDFSNEMESKLRDLFESSA
jgi:hypothetical protein